MKESLDIKTIHLQIERLKPIWDEMKTEIQKEIDNPSFTEFVVRTNEKEKYFLLILNELMDMYETYMDITNRIISTTKDITKKNILEKTTINNPMIDGEEVNEDLDEEESFDNFDDDEEGIIKDGTSLPLKERPKGHPGRRKGAKNIKL